MTVLDILRYPHPMLRRVCEPVSSEDLASGPVQRLIQDMIETMYHHPGTVGLAAPQVGMPLQIFVMDATAKTTRDALKVIVNPVIVQQSQWKYSREGCLSFPNYLVTVKRARKMTVQWSSPTSEPLTAEMKDFEALIFQHETDHLQGVLFVDRVRNASQDIMTRHMPLPQRDPSETVPFGEKSPSPLEPLS